MPTDYTNGDVITVLMILGGFFVVLLGYSHGRHR